MIPIAAIYGYLQDPCYLRLHSKRCQSWVYYPKTGTLMYGLPGRNETYADRKRAKACNFRQHFETHGDMCTWYAERGWKVTIRSVYREAFEHLTK